MALERIFVDANVFVYATGADEAGERSREILAASAEGRIDMVTSTAVLEEVWHLELSGRIDGMAGQAERVYELMRPLLAVDDAIVERALGLDTDAVGANDRIHAATCLARGIVAILTGDRGFDSIAGLRRIDPLAEGALASMVAG